MKIVRCSVCGFDGDAYEYIDFVKGPYRWPEVWICDVCYTNI